MSRKKKILIIFHLCFAFSFLTWLLIQPYVKGVVAQKSERALYEALFAHKDFFQELPASEQKLLLEGYAKLGKEKSAHSESIGHVFFKTTPPFALAWLFFSIVISLFLLFRIEGGALAAWLLPLLVLGYAFFLRPPDRPQDSLFPTESYVLTQYVSAHESQSLGKREALLLGWHRYLIAEWAKESVSLEESLHKAQVEKGLFLFNAARLKWVLAGKGDEVVMAGFTAYPSFLRLACYFMWNLFFAWFINRKEKELSSAAPSRPICSR